MKVKEKRKYHGQFFLIVVLKVILEITRSLIPSGSGVQNNFFQVEGVIVSNGGINLWVLEI